MFTFCNIYFILGRIFNILSYHYWSVDRIRIVAVHVIWGQWRPPCAVSDDEGGGITRFFFFFFFFGIFRGDRTAFLLDYSATGVDALLTNPTANRFCACVWSTRTINPNESKKKIKHCTKRKKSRPCTQKRGCGVFNCSRNTLARFSYDDASTVRLSAIFRLLHSDSTWILLYDALFSSRYRYNRRPRLYLDTWEIDGRRVGIPTISC